MKIGFDNQLYIQKQAEHIRERIQQFDNKLYLEFGGKLFDDYHASRVLPGFDVNGKIRLLQEFRDQVEIIFCINAMDIEKNKIRSDVGISYDQDVLRLMDNISAMGISINSVVITFYQKQPAALTFQKKLEQRGIKVYFHYPIPGYPTDVDTIVSERGYGLNPYVETTKPLVVVTAPGPCSGKLATCLSQIYHEHQRNVKAGYAKFETFPIWNLPLRHPVNIAYEAATVDLKDVNMIDPFHLDAYGQMAVNYNRDVETFPVVRKIISKVCGNDTLYKSPTDMGVNMAGYGVFDDAICQEAGKQEIIRRYFKTFCDYKVGRVDADTTERISLILEQLDLDPEDRTVVLPAREKAKQTGVHCMSLELPDGTMITAKNSELMNASAGVLLNSIKHLAGIADDILLISPIILEPILNLKTNTLHSSSTRLNAEEVLLALSICAATNPTAAAAIAKLDELCNCEAHSICMLPSADEHIFQKLQIRLTCDPEFPSTALYEG